MRVNIFLYFGVLAPVQLAAAIHCPPLQILESLELHPGHCVSSTLCISDDRALQPYEGQSCKRTLVALRCPGDLETTNLDGSKTRCGYSILEFLENGVMKRTCCEVLDEPPTADDNTQQHLLRDDADDIHDDLSSDPEAATEHVEVPAHEEEGDEDWESPEDEELEEALLEAMHAKAEHEHYEHEHHEHEHHEHEYHEHEYHEHEHHEHEHHEHEHHGEHSKPPPGQYRNMSKNAESNKQADTGVD